MPKVSDQHREARREQIVDAALHRFSVNGFHRTSMADVIAESGLSAGAIYGYFASKQELMRAVAERILGNRIAEFGARVGHGELPPPSRMLELMMAGLRSELPDTAVLVQLWGEGVTDPGMADMIGPIFLQLRDVMDPYLTRWGIERRGLSPDAAAAWAVDVLPVFLALVQGFLVQSALLPGFDADTYFRGVATVLDEPRA